MADKTKIEWADASWPVVQGCDVVSPGCKNCYAVNVVNRLAGNPRVNPGGILDGVVAKNRRGRAYWTGKVAIRRDRLEWPFRWKQPRKIFVPSHGDLFHEDVPDSFIDEVFIHMWLTPQHTYQILTKRPERMAGYINDFTRKASLVGTALRLHRDDELNALYISGNDYLWPWPLPNVWLGVSVEDQHWADIRIPLLIGADAAIRFISYEPALRTVDFKSWFWSAMTDDGKCAIDQVIIGGESGPRARPCIGGIENAIRFTVKQCEYAGVAPFVKQMGSVWAKGHEHGPECVSRMDLRGWRQQLLDLKGGDMEHWPEDLRLRQYPDSVEALGLVK